MTNAVKVNISERLKRIAGMLTFHETVADIGCDHGYLSIYLVSSGICKNALAMDVRKGPLQKAVNNIDAFGVSDKVTARLSNGFQGVLKDEASSAVIAGMGGPLIIKILEEGQPFKKGIRELVLSPQSEIHKVRCYLAANGYLIDYEDMLCEDGKYYQLMHVTQNPEKSQMTPPGNIYLKYGEHLLKMKHPVLKEYLEKELEKSRRVINELKEKNRSFQKSEGVLDKSSAVSKRLEELENLTKEIEEALAFYEV